MTASESRLEFHIGGMDCARTLERSLSQIEGMESVQINFATAKMEATGPVDPDAVRSRIQALGYQVLDVSDPR